MGRIILITGGARSGKSSYAERYAARANCPVAYIATAEVLDDEMAYRIRLHRERRPSDWGLWEAPKNAEHAILEAGQKYEMILFDCLTMYLSNFILSEENVPLINAKTDRYAAEETLYERTIAYAARLLRAAKETPADVVFVTNEVGTGIVPDNHLSRLYRDMVGIVNQKAAALADEVYLVTCGLAIDLKKWAERVE
ncbi:bifunctional adenosylcobinamide kinase/adenosylcobinamide-phosphate guanylyltransferase [Selenomonas sp. TAMA-11512]|uniref:bifunctional adenosylcobinamide kinase/adenosylcobinamide-phosphate guanylyltransferase n=1 Tax=Selenomonas sp. TAMA-11512 TaxID=3095337 RepID=UPI00308BD8C6|nr:bifunctional adenosylcobinamide kinase/adenosylcobinamide-phosphate guanylyltransferase [Selenomonas sp. TAMA-11512]